MNRRNFLLKSGLLPYAKALAATVSRPNVILILADDLGFSDLGCYGGEIATPNLDRLAHRGLRFTQFYNSARCCPSRASILTGLYPHQAGVGLMNADTGRPGYRGHLNDTCVTIPEVLKDAGYYTCMSGKWHLSKPGPIERGFTDYYGMLHGFDSFWDPTKYTRLPADKPARSYPQGGFYATDAITDHALDFLSIARRQQKPYFLYLTYNAPHFPLHAPPDEIAKYVPVYEKGWDAIRESRHQRMKRMKLVDPKWPLSVRGIVPQTRSADQTGWSNKQLPAWDSIGEDRRTDLVHRMAIFAAMVDRMDQNIGRLLQDLEKSSELDNTLIVFLSDNGACAEWDPWGFDQSSGPKNTLHTGDALKTMGQPGTYHSYGAGWANACNTPLRLYKHYGYEGGMCTPFIVHWPAGSRRRNQIDHRPAHITDLLPTLADVAGTAYPKRAKLQPPEGISLRPAFNGAKAQARTIYFEHEGNRAVREGKWKITSIGTSPWELYNIDADRTETRNLASQFPDVVESLSVKWRQWALRANVI